MSNIDTILSYTIIFNKERALTFEAYYKSLSLNNYPFSIYTAENEKDKSHEIYSRPNNYSLILEAVNNGSVIIPGERGSGKTALNFELIRALKNDNTLVVNINEFSTLRENFTDVDLYTFLTENIAATFFTYMSPTPNAFWSYSKDERVDLSMYLHKYVRASSKALLQEKIKKIQNGLFTTIGIKIYNTTRIVLNYGMKAATKAISDALTKHFSSLPEFDVGDAEYFRKLESEIDESFIEDEKSIFYLNKLTSLILKSKIKNIVILIDKIDEDTRFGNDADNIALFLNGIASNTHVMLNQNFKVILFTWATPFNFILSNVRTNKLTKQSLEWNKKSLEDVASKRLQVFSNKQINDLNEIFESDCQNNVDLLLEMSNENPRDLWHILDKCLKAQFTLDTSKKISNEAIMEGIKNFVTTFNYYEYYPRKANARSNTMDVYSYIKHLLKLETSEFTKDRLSTMAGTGGSTNNYVTAMENMGLIKNTYTKSAAGGVIYFIKDPKVRYAIQHNINIEAP